MWREREFRNYPDSYVPSPSPFRRYPDPRESYFEREVAAFKLTLRQIAELPEIELSRELRAENPQETI